MREIDCNISYFLSSPGAGYSARIGNMKEISYQIQVADDALPNVIEREILAAGVAEIRLVEGATALYEITDVRSMVTCLQMPLA